MHSTSSAASAATMNTLPEKRGWSRARYLIPSSVTLTSVLCGWYSIVCSLKGGLEIADPLRAAALFGKASVAIGLAIVLDNLDGRIARTIGATSEFGLELDSLADILTFGVAAAILAYTCGYGPAVGLEGPAFTVSFLFVAAGAIRLARSNVLDHAISMNRASPAHDEHYFVGLPIPAAAGLVAAIAHFHYSAMGAAGHPAAKSDLRTYSLVLMSVVALMALLMVSSFPYSKLKFAALNRKPVSVFNRLTFPSIAVAASLAIWLNSRWVVLTIAVLYVAHGPILRAARALGRPPS